MAVSLSAFAAKPAKCRDSRHFFPSALTAWQSNTETRKSSRKFKPSLKACEVTAASMAQNPLTKPAGVKKAAGRPRKTTTTPKTPAVNGTAKPGRKRKDDSVAAVSPPAKKPRVTKAPAAIKPKLLINQRSSQRLDVYVFGEGSNSELGLGTAKNAIDVKRPRLNPLIPSATVGVVSVACGGMHALALTYDGKVISWGVNDNGALGRDTAWDGGLRDIDDNKSDDSDANDSGLNPHESTPAAISGFPDGTTVVKVAAGDSISLALTDDGQVYGWGTFRVCQTIRFSCASQLTFAKNQSGILGFYQSPSTNNRRARSSVSQDHDLIITQNTPRLYAELSKIKDIACGSNHCMALSTTGQVYIWGCGEQNQLGHHINERIDVDGKACLVPSLLRTGRRKYKAIYTGADHAFAIDEKDQVWSWGLNSFGATGIAEGAGEDRASIYVPSLVASLSDPTNPVTFMCGGQHHSIAITSSGQALVFGRLDGLQTGLDISTIPASSIIYDESDRARILIQPTPIPNIGANAVHASAGVDHTIVLNADGKAWSWGISVNYQTGLGTTEDVRVPTLIDNTAVRGKQLTWSGCGGQFSMLAAPAAGTASAPVTNGV